MQYNNAAGTVCAMGVVGRGSSEVRCVEVIVNKWQQNMTNKNGRRVRKLMRQGKNCQCRIGSGATRGGGTRQYLTLTVCGVNRAREREKDSYSAFLLVEICQCAKFFVWFLESYLPAPFCFTTQYSCSVNDLWILCNFHTFSSNCHRLRIPHWVSQNIRYVGRTMHKQEKQNKRKFVSTKTNTIKWELARWHQEGQGSRREGGRRNKKKETKAGR